MMRQVFLEEALDAMQDMVRVLSPERRVVLSNASYRAAFGDQTGARCYEMFCAGGECAHCVSKVAWDTHKSADKRHRHRGRIYWINASPIFSKEGELQGVVEVMRDVTEMDAEQKRLRVQNRRLMEEMNSAARMQRELFVANLPEEMGVSLHSCYLPANRVGGDFFGCLNVNGKAVFYLADVSGHGMSSAMIGLLVTDAIRKAAVSGEESPAAILAGAQKEFCNITRDPQVYVTVFLGILDPENGRFRYSTAAHHAAPVFCTKEGVRQLSQPSFPICSWMDEIEYEEQELFWDHGDRLLAYTDGLTDERSSDLTEEKLSGLVCAHDGEALMEELERHILPDREDDVCLLLIKRK
ncbi:MAG: SpoIIE family protein phosphatase [Clostridia bacterium]|nr:SpoIIE family protein phosphatase [Clostridia bacterium]